MRLGVVMMAKISARYRRAGEETVGSGVHVMLYINVMACREVAREKGINRSIARNRAARCALRGNIVAG